MFAFLSRQLVRASAGVVLLAGVGGVPAWLTVVIGRPMPDHLPTGEELANGLTAPVTDHMVVDLLAVAAWLLWAAFLHAVATEAIAAARGVRAARRGRVNPLRPVAATLITALVLGTVPAAAAGASPTTAQAAPATNVDLGAAIQASAREGHATFHVGDTRYIYVVKRGDYLSKIAKAWLGDADRWPEICTLNKHRHFPNVGGTLRDCNLIYPGWDLKLPPDAHPPVGAQPKTPPPTASPEQRRPPPAPPPPEEAMATPCSTESAPQGTADPALPSATASTAPTVSTSAIAAPTTQPSSADPAPAIGNDDEHGVPLPDGGWVPWALAAAVSAAAAMVWLQRRRRYTSETVGDLPTELPPPVTQLRRAVLRNPDLRISTDEAEQAADVPALTLLPPGGIGLIGDGAHAAARAALISVLSSGGPHRPDARAEVVVDATALTTLIGSDPDPRIVEG